MTQVNFGPAGTHLSRYLILFFFNDTATTEIYTLSLHDALPISGFQVHVEDAACYDHEAFRPWRLLDRKSTRLNSSHSQISYAVFCLKKKNISKSKTSIIISRKRTSHTFLAVWTTLFSLQCDTVD